MRMSLSRPHARQLISHGHILVNGKKCDIPSRLVEQGDNIEVKKDKTKKALKDSMEVTRTRDMPEWLALDEETLTGTVLRLPARDEVCIVTEEQLIVEFSSK